MAGKVLNIKVCSPLKLRSGLTGNYHAICHYLYNLPLPAIKMNEITPNRLKFYEYVNRDISIEQFEDWVYNSTELEYFLPTDHYNDLISFNFKSHDTLPFIESLIKKLFDWEEYEKWRTIKLLKSIKNQEIELVLATRKMRQLYMEQIEECQTPFISVGLAIGYESELDRCPIEAEYDQWNSEALKKQLEPVEWYRNDIFESVTHELEELLNPDLKTIDLEFIVSIKNLHETFSEKLKFPDYYGNNWDALWDTITGIVEMPQKLVLKNWDRFARTFPKDSKILRRIIDDYNKGQMEREIVITAGNSM